MTHEQAWTHAHAPAPRSIAGIVDALNQFQSLKIIEIQEEIYDRVARIKFTYGQRRKDHWELLAEFVLGYLGPKLAEMVGNDVRLSIQVTEHGDIFGDLMIDRKSIPKVESAIHRLSSDFNIKEKEKDEWE